MASVQELRSRRIQARIPGYLVCQRAGMSRARLSEIECGHVLPAQRELATIERVVEELIVIRQRVAERATECEWPVLGV